MHINSPLFNKYLNEAYLVLHRDRGNLGGGENSITLVLGRNDFNPQNISTYPAVLTSYEEERERTYWLVTYTVTPSNNALYNLTIKDYENSNVTITKTNVSCKTRRDNPI